MSTGAIIAKEHHEKWDGSGYPEGLSGNAINVFGRIVALADVYDALRHKRCYKEPWTLQNVVDEINAQKGTHFEPKLVEVFNEKLDELEAVLSRFPD